MIGWSSTRVSLQHCINQVILKKVHSCLMVSEQNILSRRTWDIRANDRYRMEIKDEAFDVYWKLIKCPWNIVLLWFGQKLWACSLDISRNISCVSLG